MFMERKKRLLPVIEHLHSVLKDKGLQKVYVHGEEEAPASSHRTSPQFKVTVFPL